MKTANDFLNFADHWNKNKLINSLKGHCKKTQKKNIDQAARIKYTEATL